MTDMDDAELEKLFAAARAQPREPKSALSEQVLADAFALQPPPGGTKVGTRVDPRRGGALWAWFANAAIPAGLTAATAAGLLIGFSSSESVTMQAAGLLETDLGMDLVHRFPAISGFLGEI